MFIVGRLKKKGIKNIRKKSFAVSESSFMPSSQNQLVTLTVITNHFPQKDTLSWDDRHSSSE